MSGKAKGISLGYGFAGVVAGTPDDITTSKPVDTDSDNIEFGKPVFLNSADDTYEAATPSNVTAAAFAGIAKAEVKQLNTYVVGQDVGNAGFYAPNEMADVLQRGLISVECVYGTPLPGGAVYVRKTLNSSFPAEKVGDLRAAADGGNTVQLTTCTWLNKAIDNNRITTLKIKTINN